MGLSDFLHNIGKIIAGILAVIVLIQLLFVLVTDCRNVTSKDFKPDKCIENMIFIIIPTEVSIAQIFSSTPTILLIFMILYWLFVKPYE